MIDVNQIKKDTIQGAKLLGVRYSQNLIDQVFDEFEDKFAHHIVDFKTTNKVVEKRGLFFRYLEENRSCIAWDRANQSQLLPKMNREVDRLIPEMYETFPLMADGVDFEVNQGLVKIWLLTKGHFPVEEAFKVPSLPKSVIAHREFFKKYHLDTLHIIAADYYHNSMNLYFVVYHPDQKTPDFYKKLLQDQNIEIPPNKILELCSQTVEIAVTFNWKSSTIERLCCYVPGFTRDTLPQDIDPLFTQFSRECPSLVENPSTVPGFSFSPKGGTYIKLDLDYNGQMVPLFLKSLRPELSLAGA